MENKIKFRIYKAFFAMTYLFAFIAFFVMLIGIICQNSIDDFKGSIYDDIISISFLGSILLSIISNIFLSFIKN